MERKIKELICIIREASCRNLIYCKYYIIKDMYQKFKLLLNILADEMVIESFEFLLCEKLKYKKSNSFLLCRIRLKYYSGQASFLYLDYVGLYLKNYIQGSKINYDLYKKFIISSTEGKLFISSTKIHIKRLKYGGLKSNYIGGSRIIIDFL